MRIWQENLIREKRKDKENAKDAGVDPDEMEETSPFATIAATMGWDTFHLVHSLWLSIVDLPNKSPEKDWGLQVRFHKCCEAAEISWLYHTGLA